jgi:Uma2 family endonuclease
MVMTKLATVDDLWAMPDDGFKYELVRGEIRRMTPPGGDHGQTAGNVLRYLLNYAFDTDRGVVFTNDTGVILGRNPDTVRGPDIVYVRIEDLPPPPRPKFLDLVPTLVVEIVSPSQSRAEVMEKVEEYRARGIPLIWVVFPKTKTVHVDGAGRESVTRSAGEALDGGDLLPGLPPISLAELFRER